MSISYRFIVAAAIFSSACTPTKNEEYQLNYEECKKMQVDQGHRFWKQPIAIQGCELIIFDTEMEGESNE